MSFYTVIRSIRSIKKYVETQMLMTWHEKIDTFSW
jgi:hypothetical protein